MTTKEDLLMFLNGLAPDPLAAQDARAFLAAFPAQQPVGFRLNDLLMTFVNFHKQHAGPGLPEGLSEAVAVLSYAASGLAVFLEGKAGDGWESLAVARLWASERCQQSGPALTLAEVTDLFRAVRQPYTLPEWVDALTAVGKRRDAGHCAMWYAVARLLEQAPTLEDGEGEMLICAVLEAFNPDTVPELPPLTLASSPEVARALEMIQEGVAAMNKAQDEAPHLFTDSGLTDPRLN